MLHCLADENFSGHLVSALARQRELFDIVRVQDVGLSGADDPAVLAWAASSHRVVITHDRNTMPGHALRLLAQNSPMAGVIVVSSSAPRSEVLASFTLLAERGGETEWEGQIIYLPLR